jgi:aryl-alcohol dehydrogenase-like predicted oxidoreductase
MPIVRQTPNSARTVRRNGGDSKRPEGSTVRYNQKAASEYASDRSERVRYRQLGASELVVSEISLGSWLTYGVGVETETARACLDRAFELGVNFVDTANVYGRGAAEEFLGDALAGRDRSSYVLATKLFFPMSDVDRGLSAVHGACAPTTSISTSVTVTTARRGSRRRCRR